MGKMRIVMQLHKIGKKLDKNPDLEKKMEKFLSENNLDITDPSCLNMKTAKRFIKEYERLSKHG